MPKKKMFDFNLLGSDDESKLFINISKTFVYLELFGGVVFKVKKEDLLEKMGVVKKDRGENLVDQTWDVN